MVPDTGCVKEVRKCLLKSEELRKRVVMPTWLDDCSEAVKGFYPEAKQTVAAILAIENSRGEITTAFQQDDFSAAIRAIIKGTTAFLSPRVNLKGDTLVSFAEAGCIAVLDSLKVPGRSKPELLGEMRKMIQSLCGKEK